MPFIGIRFCRVCGQSESGIELSVPEFTYDRRQRVKVARKHRRPTEVADVPANVQDLFAVHEAACEAALHAADGPRGVDHEVGLETIMHAPDMSDEPNEDDASFMDESAASPEHGPASPIPDEDVEVLGAAAGVGEPEMRYSSTPRGTCKPTEGSMLGRMFWLGERFTGRPGIVRFVVCAEEDEPGETVILYNVDAHRSVAVAMSEEAEALAVLTRRMAASAEPRVRAHAAHEGVVARVSGRSTQKPQKLREDRNDDDNGLTAIACAPATALVGPRARKPRDTEIHVLREVNRKLLFSKCVCEMSWRDVQADDRALPRDPLYPCDECGQLQSPQTGSFSWCGSTYAPAHKMDMRVTAARSARNAKNMQREHAEVEVHAPVMGLCSLPASQCVAACAAA